MKQHFLVSAKLVLVRGEDHDQQLPTNQQVYKYMIHNEYVDELVENVCGYQDFYDDVTNIRLEKDLSLNFDLVNTIGGPKKIDRVERFGTDLLTSEQVFEDLKNSIARMGLIDHEYSEMDEFLYKDEKGDILASIDLVDLNVVQLL